MSHINHDQRGFLLVETMVAIFLISVALVAVAGVFAQATRSNLQAGEYTVATNLAQEKLEQLKSKDNLFWQSHDGHFSSPAEPIVINRKTYQRAYSFSILPEQGQANSSDLPTVAHLAQVAVRVTVQDSPTEVTLNTYVLIDQSD